MFKTWLAALLFLVLAAFLWLPDMFQRNSLNLALAAYVPDGWCNPAVQKRVEDRLQRDQSRRTDPKGTARLQRLDALRSLCANPSRTSPGAFATAIPQARVETGAGALSLPLATVASLLQIQPEYALDGSYRVGDWSLVGFDLVEESLEVDDQIDAVLHWRNTGTADYAPQRLESSGSVAWVLGNRMYQTITGPNLVQNGGFEQTDAAGRNVVAGFNRERYEELMPPEARFAAHGMDVAERDGYQSLCGALDNSALDTPSGYVALQQNSTPGARYLVGAQVLDAGPGTHVGILQEWPQEKYRNLYVAKNQVAGRWSHFAGVVETTPGTDKVSVQLLNQDESRSVCFDDVFMLQLPAGAGEVSPNG
jgi:hypothetical protein